MSKIFFIIFNLLSLVVFSQTSTIQNQEWVVTSSSIKFKIKNAGFTVDGSLSGLTAKIIFDATKGYGNSIDAVMDAKSINTGNESRDGHLKKTEYFDVLNFPSINMKSTLFGKETDGSFKGYFKLTIKGKTKDVVVPFSFIEKDGKGILKGTFTIDRLDFGVGESSMILSDRVIITIEVNVIKK